MYSLHCIRYSLQCCSIYQSLYLFLHHIWKKVSNSSSTLYAMDHHKCCFEYAVLNFICMNIKIIQMIIINIEYQFNTIDASWVFKLIYKNVHHMSAQMNGNLFAQNLQRQIRLSLEEMRGHNMQRHIPRTARLQTIRRAAVRETGVCRDHGGLMENPPEHDVRMVPRSLWGSSIEPQLFKKSRVEFNIFPSRQNCLLCAGR